MGWQDEYDVERLSSGVCQDIGDLVVKIREDISLLGVMDPLTVNQIGALARELETTYDLNRPYREFLDAAEEVETCKEV